MNEIKTLYNKLFERALYFDNKIAKETFLIKQKQRMSPKNMNSNLTEKLYY